MHHPVVPPSSSSSSSPSAAPSAPVGPSAILPASSSATDIRPPPAAANSSAPSDLPSPALPPAAASLAAPSLPSLAAIRRLCGFYTRTPSFLFFLLLSLAHVLVLGLNQTPVKLHLLLLSLPSTLSSLLVLTSLYAALVTSLFFIAQQHHLLSELSVARQARLQVEAERAALEQSLKRMRQAASSILIPTPLDALVDKGLEIGMGAWQQRPGMLQATVMR